ncbi:MAG: sodium-dependent transporter [Calditrichaceae bacterium]
MAESNKELFTSRFGLIAATLGMAIGAGNIWRFPRLAGQYGGSFLIPWFLFLFLWSIPLLIVEFSIGKRVKMGVIGSFKEALGKKFTWMGLFVGFCTTAILFYYSVVCGWSLKYFVLALTGQLGTLNHAVYWQEYTASVYEPVFFHLVSILAGAFIIYRGIVHGIEKFSKVFVPLLYVLLITAAVKALTLPGASKGLSYFFSINLETLSNYKVWLEGLSQSAWSTGAGWGLLLTYAIYVKKDEKIVQNSFLTGIGNNFASILAGLVVIPTVFALSVNSQAANDALSAGNQGLAFIVIPQLFAKMPGSELFTTIFFLALFFAAMSSLISMIELAVRVLMDFGFSRKKSVVLIAVLTSVIGMPSAISLSFFNNQDWVWGLGLMLSGFFFTVVVIKTGAKEFVEKWLAPKRKPAVYIKMFRILFYFVLPLEFIVMLSWWLYQSVLWYPESWWNPLEIFSPGTSVFQWTIVILLGILLNKKLTESVKTNNRI